MKIVFLGTACMVPTKERNHPAILLNYENENILIDCGENTQRQLKIIDFSLTKITKILLTHWHSDHVLGLPGLLQSLAAGNYSKTLEIYGPIGTNKFLNLIFKTYIPRTRTKEVKIKIFEIKNEGVFLNQKTYSIAATPKLDHFGRCLAYSFKEKDKRKINLDYINKIGIPKGPLLGELQRGKDINHKGKLIKVGNATKLVKGKKITIILDTALCNSCFKIAENSDLLICEATYAQELKHKAKDYKHLTAKQAALIAKKSKSKKLILTHFSQRYKDTKILEKEAKEIFGDVTSAKDFMELKI